MKNPIEMLKDTIPSLKMDGIVVIAERDPGKQVNIYFFKNHVR